MKVFTDHHHNDLTWALHRLFEQRLGFELYFPVGMDWLHSGYWKIADPYPATRECTAGQFLDHCGSVVDEEWLPGVNFAKDNIYYLWEPVHEYFRKSVTFETFRQMKFDIILSTYKPHDGSFEQLRNLFHPNAKLVAQMGNTNQKTHLPNVITSVPYGARAGQNVVYAHQELDPACYQFTVPSDTSRNIYSVVNCCPDLGTFRQYQSFLPEVNMKYYGGSCPDGGLYGARGVGEKMREANLGWHCKQGIGHSSMGWLYSGRGVITRMSEHFAWGGDAPILFEDGRTCIDLGSRTVHENSRIIRRALEPDECRRLGENAKNRFNDIVNYDQEEVRVREFLSKLL